MPIFSPEKLPIGKPNFLQSEGDVFQKNGNDVKVINRLQIGDTQVSFEKIARWLDEMCEAGTYIASYHW